MADLTVSADIDAFMGAANKVAARTALGGFTDPLVAYVRSDGNNTSGTIGRRDLPYLTAQAAYDDGAKYFDVGADLNAGVVITTANEELFVRGAGKTSELSIVTDGFNLIYWDIACISCYVYIVSHKNDGSANAGNVVSHYGYIAGIDTTPGPVLSTNNDGRNGGNIEIHGPAAISESIQSTGGNAVETGNPQSGGNGGNIVINAGVKFLPGVVLLTSQKGAALNGGSEGTDGNITLRGCDTGTTTPTAGAGTITYIAAILPDGFHAS